MLEEHVVDFQVCLLDWFFIFTFPFSIKPFVVAETATPVSSALTHSKSVYQALLGQQNYQNYKVDSVNGFNL